MTDWWANARARHAVVVLCLVGVAMTAQAQTAIRPPAGANPAAWRALEERRYGVAVELFEEAARRAPRDAWVRVGAGAASYLQGKNADARRWLEAALAIQPALTEASLLLGRSFYRDGLLSDAIKAYEIGLERAPGHQELTATLERWRREAATQAQFFQAQGAHFTVLFEGPSDDAAAQRALFMLEDAYWRLGAEFTAYVTQPITVVLYTEQQFRDVTRSPAWAGGAYDGRIKVPMGGRIENDELRRVLEHELVHAWVAALAGPTIPAWLNEGLATALEPQGLTWAERHLADSKLRVPFARLGRGFGGLAPEEARVAYAQSAVAARRLLDRLGGAAVTVLLQALGSGVPFDEAFHQTVSLSVEEFLRQVGP